MSRPLAAAVLSLALAACSRESFPTADSPRAPSPSLDISSDPVGVCPDGGYFTTLLVDPATTEAGDGRHFTRITDAIAAARDGRIARNERTAPFAACRITISVAPGTYSGGFTPDPSRELFPLLLDVPRISLEGGLVMQLDGSGRATGDAQNPADVTTLLPIAPLVQTPVPQAIIIVTDSSAGFHGDGIEDTRGDDVTIRGLAFRSGYSTGNGGGFGIFALRAQDLRIESNRFESRLGSAVDLRASTAVVEENSAIDLSPASCAICLAGDNYPAGTADHYQVRANYIKKSGLVGVSLIPVVAQASVAAPANVRPYALPIEANVRSTIENNLIREQLIVAPGTAIRVSTLGPGASALTQRNTVFIHGNELIQNRFGIIFDAGFPPQGIDPNGPTGHLTADLSGNTFSGTCQANLLVAFTRHTRGLGLPTAPANAGSLKSSDYVITLNNNLPWTSAWYHHPAQDSGVVLNNTLTVDGNPIPNGTVHGYTATGCPPATPPALTNAWIGLKNSDDVGTKFDLRAEVLRNASVIATSQLDAVNGGSSTFNNAVERMLTAVFTTAPSFAPGDVLGIRFLVRIAIGVPGHTRGTARLWYGDAIAASGFTTLINGASTTLYLGTGFTLTPAPGPSPKKSVDVLVNKNVEGNPFKPFGTWTKVY